MKGYKYLAALLFASLLLTLLGWAQLIPRGASIVAAEYFVGTDPGVGNGTPLTISTPGQSVNLEITSLSLPLNQTVFLRCKDASNKWSATTPYRFKGFGNGRSLDITSAEYFIGSDPGSGNGTAISLTTGPNPGFEALNIAISTGQRISTRVRDADGRWSSPVTYAYRGFGNNRTVDITRAEYFIGSDPGAGNGTAISLTAGPNPGFEALNITLSTGQIIWTRARDADGRWGSPVPYTFRGYGNNRSIDITRAEYFIGPDPGPGNGTAISVSPGPNPTFEELSISLSTGQGISTRVRDSDGRWSGPVAKNYPNEIVIRAELSTPQPAPTGTGTSMIASDGNFNSAVEAIEGTLSNWNRIDSIWVRVQSSSYYWSFPVGDRTIYYPATTISSLAPDSSARLQKVNVLINGTNFIQGITTIDFGANITIDSVRVLSETQLRAYINISATATTGLRSVSVSNPSPGGGTAVLSNSFKIVNPTPLLTSISPVSGNRLETLTDTLNGSNFISGVSSVSYGSGITVNSTSVASASRMTVSMTISSGAATGARKLYVTNSTPGGGTDSSRTFTVNNPAPTISSVTPSGGNRLQTLNVVTVNGTNFISGVSNVSFGSNVTMNSTSISSTTQITANVTIDSAAALGARDVSVTNSSPGGGTASLAGGFTVNNPSPILTSISPNLGRRLDTLTIGVKGSNFFSGSTTVGFGSAIGILSTTVHTSDSLSARITISTNATSGVRNVSVTNPAPGGGIATLTNGFTVFAPGIQVSASAVAFGNIKVGERKDSSVIITNTGNDTLKISSIVSSNAVFFARPTTKNVPSSQSFTDTLRFTPIAIGTASGNILITSNATSSPDTIKVSGYGFGTATLQLNTPTVSFGNVKVGQFKDTTITITNSGNDTLKITDVSSADTIFSGRPKVLTIAHGASAHDTVRFKPVAPGAVTGKIIVTSNATSASDTITVAGTGLTVTISFSTKTIPFGNVKVGQFKDTTVTITNTGNDTLKITNVSSADTIFSGRPKVLTISPGASANDTVRFKPAALGAVTGKLIVASNASSAADTITVSGTGMSVMISFNTKTISFGNVKVGQFKDTTVTITNTGNDTLKITNITSADTLFSARPRVLTIAPAENAKDTLRFKPAALSAVSGKLIVTSNAASSPDTIVVSGTGTLTNAQDLFSQIPREYALAQNYPNPFNPATTIRYDLPTRSTVRIEIFNILGQRVVELLNAEKEAGYHSIEWQAKEPSGIYLYRIESIAIDDPQKRFVDAKRMILIR